MQFAIQAAFRAAIGVGCVLAWGVAGAMAQENPLQDGATWDDLKELVLKGATPTSDADLFALEAPMRAEDPAFVPVHLTQGAGGPPIEKLTVVIDENPAPVAAEITLGPAMMPLDLELRLRVNAYSNVRAIATTGTSSLLAGRYVKANGGCAAPASKDIAAMAAEMGKMRFQEISSEKVGGKLHRVVKLMIRHPNASGFQRDQVTLLTVPAHFIDVLELRQGNDLLFRMEAGISISEDPVFQFRFTDNGAETIEVHAEDTEGNIFEGSFPLAGI
ncbi:MAG: quinoprotein dehydrogenase-associated SoxYZ-like carrier [Paracoccaceae bacterium]